MSRPKLIMMVGLPCSGKSYKSQELAKEYNAEIFSSDELRVELFGDVNCQDKNQELFIELHRRIKDCLKAGKSAIYDACSISYKRRMAFLQELKNIPCEKICVLMATPYEECLKRNAERDRKVPEEVIKMMYTNFNIPYAYEGFDDIIVEYNGYENFYGDPYKNVVIKYKNYNQNNSHHANTLGDHCRDTFVQLAGEAPHIAWAGLVHDCAKPFCATYTNKKGEVTSECHYYSHQFCSSYSALFYDYGEANPLDISILVLWHMQPYFNKEEKTKNKYKKLWGEDLYNNVMKLHEADKNSH